MNPPTTFPDGRLDIHCHLIPGVDDGCADIDQTIACIQAMQSLGYVGSICTPHIWIGQFPDNTPANIRRWTDQLRAQLAQRGVDYMLWPGGELRLFESVINWCQTFGVPTLADSRCVLLDFWVPEWKPWIDTAFDWLLKQGYTPIWAHPERLGLDDEQLIPRMDELTAKGVVLQGNFQCASGEAGPVAQQRLRRWLTENRYTLLATDTHRPNSMHHRLTGFTMLQHEFGSPTLDLLTNTNPRKLILGQ